MAPGKYIFCLHFNERTIGQTTRPYLVQHAKSDCTIIVGRGNKLDSRLVVQVFIYLEM